MHTICSHGLDNDIFRCQLIGRSVKETAAAKCACLKRIEDTIGNSCKFFLVDLPYF